MIWKNKFTLLLGSLFFTSATILASQVLLARESRVAFGFGLEFIIFSFAIAGVGLGGLIVYFKSLKRDAAETGRYLTKLFPFFTILSLVPFVALHFLHAPTDSSLVNFLGLFFFLSSLAFYTVGGILIATILKYHAERVSLLYFLDLLGGAFGALIVIYLMDSYGTTGTALFIYAAALIATVLYLLYRFGFKVLTLGVVALLAIPLALPPAESFQVSCRSGRDSLLVESNSFSQINIDPISPVDAARSKEVIGIDYQPGKSNFKILNLSRDCKPSVAYILKFKELSDVNFLLKSINNLPYLLRDYQHVLEIGSGPGNWVIIGALNKVPDITAVEINPLVIDTFRRTVDYNIYQNPSVNLQVVEGRNFVASSSKKYDLIFLFTKTYGGVGTAAYAFSENYLFTKEAYQLYLDRLSPHGVLAIAGDNWFHTILTENLVPTLSSRGLDPINHLLIAEGQNYSLTLAAKDGFSAAEQGKLASFAQPLGYQPKILTSTNVTQYLAKNTDVTDDRPFLINTSDLITSLGSSNAINIGSEQSGLTFQYLLWLLGLTALAYAAVIILPFRRGVPVNKNTVYLTAFFSLVGVGFITFELSLVQKLALFLERPQWPISVGLAAILFFGGLGSLVTSRVRSLELRPWVSRAVLALLLLSLSYLYLFDYLFTNFSSLPEVSRIILTVSALAIPSFLAGMVFPIGLRMTALVSVAFIPWMYAIDGVTSVLGGVVSKIIFLLWGFKTEFMIGILMYCLALLVLFKIRINGDQTA
ncbi:MAG: hypothetical protein HYW37_01095 [Candidatus Colwellbacteria bacterium]|nr:hypothetical protein [Candidatus Colwellbacteria bacterium]